MKSWFAVLFWALSGSLLADGERLSGGSQSGQGADDKLWENSSRSAVPKAFQLDFPSRPRNVYLPPLFSFMLPGFDQWWEGQYLYAAGWTGVGLFGEVFASQHSERLVADKTDDELQEVVERGLGSTDNHLRGYIWGKQLYQTVGGLSAWQSFRSAALNRPDEFSFLDRKETVQDVLLAPFRFDFLGRWTTLAPLGVIGAIAALQSQAEDADLRELELQKRDIEGSDVAYSGLFSYNAGTHEEAMFRGWLMPVGMHLSGNEHIANFGTAALFAAAHLPSNPTPLPQFLLGSYLGWLSQSNGWTLSEAVFIHVWWDVIAILSAYQFEKLDEEQARLPILLPPLKLVF